MSGLVLFAFVTTHLVNSSFGLVSIAAMDSARAVLMAPWANPLGLLLLTASLWVHAALGLRSVYLRNTLRMTRTDMVQLVTSLAIVPLLTPHVVGTAVAARFGIVPSYASLMPYFWIDAPLEGLRQVFLLTFVWVHGCIGFHTFMRIQPGWRRVAGFIYPLVVAIPVLALLGFVGAGNEAIERRDNPAAVAAPAITDYAAPVAEENDTPEPVAEQPQLSFNEILAILSRINWTVFYAYLAIVAAVFAARQIRLSGQRDRVRVDFGGETVTAKAGLTLLEMARIDHIPVANLCRGRGRCGTCRVRILHAEGQLPAPSEIESATLERVNAGRGVRLSCQMKPPPGRLIVERVLPPYLRHVDLAVAAQLREVDGPADAEQPAKAEAA